MPPSGDNMRILIADDSALLRQRVSAQLLRDPRVSVIAEARDTQETLALIEAERPDAVVLDLSMPGGGGIAVLEALRGRRSGPAVIVLTNHVLEEYRERCLALGAAAFTRYAFSGTDLCCNDMDQPGRCILLWCGAGIPDFGCCCSHLASISTGSCAGFFGRV